METSDKPVTKASERKVNIQAGGMFRMTEWAARRVEAKRKRRGLGELKPRKKNPIKQILVNSCTLAIANLAIGPLERCRILL